MYYRTLSAYGHVDCLRICVSQIRKYMFCLSALAAECTRVCMCIWAENDMYTSRHSIENDRTVACNAAAYSGIQRQQTEENSNMYDFHASMIYIRICVRLLTDRRTLTMQPFTYVVMRHFQTAYHTHVSVCVCVNCSCVVCCVDPRIWNIIFSVTVRGPALCRWARKGECQTTTETSIQLGSVSASVMTALLWPCMLLMFKNIGPLRIWLMLRWANTKRNGTREYARI